MLRKSPYTEENYNYITSMMDNMKLQENLLNQPIYNPNNFVSNQQQQPAFLWDNVNNNTNHHPHSNILNNIGNIDTKKQIETEFSVYGNSDVLFFIYSFR